MEIVAISVILINLVKNKINEHQKATQKEQGSLMYLFVHL